MTCEWCGHDHEIKDLCTKRPTWGRRGFLALMGAGVVGLALPAFPDGNLLLAGYLTEVQDDRFQVWSHWVYPTVCLEADVIRKRR